MNEVKVDLGDRSYVITIGSGILSRIGELVSEVRRPSAALVVSNPTVARLYGNVVASSLEAQGMRTVLLTVRAGERAKTLGTVRRIYDALVAAKMDRASAVVALGGGVIGDLAGFAAATYMRGIDFYQVPTTLLAQVDASVGGKTGVDLPQGKNLVGAFHQPRRVIIDILTLGTLPARELRAGLAEVLKHGIIWDKELFCFVDKNAKNLLSRRAEALQEAIKRSVEIKRSVVEQDERESGLRSILNFGHTIGHAIEVVTGYRKYRHGEAVAAGMFAEALLAEREGVAEENISEPIANAVRKLGLEPRLDVCCSPGDLLGAIELDKKVKSGEIRLALPVKIGKCGVFPVERSVILEVLREVYPAS
ncbi:MAG: 3-dehydroquinate synthase [Armatimonadota bacterium]